MTIMRKAFRCMLPIITGNRYTEKVQKSISYLMDSDYFYFFTDVTRISCDQFKKKPPLLERFQRWIPIATIMNTTEFEGHCRFCLLFP